MAYSIRHMGLGGILDQAIEIVREHLWLLSKIVLLCLMPVYLFQGFIALSVAPTLPPNPSREDIAAAQLEQLARMPWFIGISLIVFIIFIPIANASVIQAVGRVYLGESITAIEALKHGLNRLFPLLGTSFLMWMAIYAGFFLCIIPGIYFAIWFGLSQHVVVLEGIAGTQALKRSKHLVHTERGKFLALSIILVVISWMINMGARMIPQQHLQVVATAVVQSLVTMIWSAALVVFYFSCRCAVENFDLYHLARSIHSEPLDGDSNAIVDIRS